jgi:hypothetical protein
LNQALKIYLVWFFVLFPFLIKAQDSIQFKNNKDLFTQPIGQIIKDHTPIDIIDIGRFIKNKNSEFRYYTLDYKYRKLHASAVPAAGYTLVNGFIAAMNGNVAFYASDLPYQKITNIVTSIAFTEKKQIIFPLSINYWTKGNKFNIISEWRYLQYPSPDYQIPVNTTGGSSYTLNFSSLKFHQSVFRNISKNLYAGGGYYLDYIWNIEEQGLEAGTVTTLEQYGLSKTEISSGLSLRLLYDSRLNQINPDNGFYANIEFRPCFKFMGSQNNWQGMLFDFRKYIKLPNQSKNILALWSYNWLTLGNTPYLMLPSTGWDDGFNTGRGYIQSRFRGKDMIYMEAEYRFGITNNGLIGGVLFVNTQALNSDTGQKIVTIAPACGTGIRVKFNKFSRTNVALDYGFGLDGSHGFFVNLGEVF